MSGPTQSSALPETIAPPELSELVEGTRPLAVEFGEFVSACTMLIDALGGQPFGAPLAWRRAVVSELDARDVAALAPFVKSQPQLLPSSLCILPHRSATGLAKTEEDLERIASLPAELLVEQLPSDGHWGAVARDPVRWLDAFTRAVRRACQGLRGPWADAAGLLDREAERVGVAAVRGAQRELIGGRFPPGMLRLEGRKPHGSELRDCVGMVPLLAGPRSTHVWFIDGKLTHIAYPLPGAWRLLDRDAPPPAALEALLGPQRALIIRKLDRPTTSGALADALMAVPSAASHHLAILEQGGLVERERQGQRIVVRRTARGTELLALYDRP